MKNRPHLLAGLAALLSLAPPPPAAAQEVSEVEARLRESLRGAMLQLRNVEAERARLEAELQVLTTQSERQIKDLTARLEEAVKRANEEKTVADQQLADSRGKLAEEHARVAAFAEALEKWKAAYFQITEIARAKEAERSRLLDKSLRLEHTVADRERRNLELYHLGNEILDRYEKFALGRALLAREPFTGLAKVRLEEQVQDYKDKISDGMIREGDPVPLPSPDAEPGEPGDAPGESFPPDAAEPAAEELPPAP